MNNIKAVLFDMDGVLVDAKEWHYEALNQALSIFGVPISRSDHLTYFDGLPTKEKLKELSNKGILPLELIDFINKLKQNLLNEIIVKNCKPIFSKQYAMAKLKQKGYKIAVCSNSIRSSVEVMMQLSQLDKYIDLILSNQDVSKSKPDPEIYHKAIEYFNLEPEECLILEDNPHGIAAARASRAHVLEIPQIKDTNFTNILNKINTIEGQI
jgi:HAD superfamily hydrolase (TIGR01509 family)